MSRDRYDVLVHHPFVEGVFDASMNVAREIGLPTGFKVVAEYRRDPTEAEFYALQAGHSLAHLLTVVQQLEHTVIYMSNFSANEVMKKSGINRATHLLWSVENYIVRTQTVYDRLLLLVDRIFHIQNQANQITHESIVTNTHIARSPVPRALKQVRKAVAKYRLDRNSIMHANSHLEEGLRRIEGYMILVSDPRNEDADLEDDLKSHVRDFVKQKKREYSTINRNVCSALDNAFTALQTTFASRSKALK